MWLILRRMMFCLPIKNFIERIENSSHSTFKLLENLLEWSRMQTGKISFYPDRIVVDQLIANAIDQVSGMAISKNIEIKSDIGKEITIIADENMLIAILRNLLSNAIKFTLEKGQITVRVVKNEKQTCFEVEDNGVGMSEEILGKLFKVNEKVSMPGTNKETGTGLGLILCKEFIDQHGGKISAESELGKGSIFRFCILGN